MSIPTTRARRLQALLYHRYGHGHVSRVARALGYSRQHVSAVLNEDEPSDILLDKIEAWLHGCSQ